MVRASSWNEKIKCWRSCRKVHDASAVQNGFEDKKQNAAKRKTPTAGLPARDPGAAVRGGFSNKWQYLLTCIGCAVGLGNIWRFPATAYSNGGAAFLFAYLVVAIGFGLPILYMELIMGQLNQAGGSIAFRNYMPLLQGLGFGTAILSFCDSLFYNVIIAWACIYIVKIISGTSYEWARCDNYWNTIYCSSLQQNALCAESGEGEAWYNGSCGNNSASFRFENNMTAMSASEEFFNYYVLEKTDTIEEWGSFNWKVCVALLVCWTLSGLGLIGGVKILGRVAYIIIAILFVRGVTLPGASDGIRYYLLEPDFSMLINMQTWRAAVTQCCFSLGIGIGTMLALSSYNPRTHNPYKDAVIIAAADSFMSVFGGIAVFSILGFMAKSLGKTVPEVVESGLTLAFVAYPTAMAEMSVSWLWSFLFFFMIFLLGISTMFGFVESAVTCISDASPMLRRHHALVVSSVCALGFGLTFLFVFGNSVHWFNVFNEYVGSFGLALIVIFEIALINFGYGNSDNSTFGYGSYDHHTKIDHAIVLFSGPCRYWRDVRAMLGPPRHVIGKILGPSGWYLKIAMFVTAPIFVVVIVISTFSIQRIVYGQGARSYIYPPWTETFGWIIGSLSAVAIPVGAIVNVVRYWRDGSGLLALLRAHPEHPALVYHLDDGDQESEVDNREETASPDSRS